MPKGFSTLELLVVVTIIAIITAISVPTTRGLRDRIAVSQATYEAATFIQKGRLEAVIRSQRIRLLFGASRHQAFIESATPGLPDTLLFTWSGPDDLGVSFVVSRREVRFQPTGIGYGAANTKMVFRRGRAGDSLSTSILGRLRRR